ncbi:MAG: hypothetical protein JWM53_3586 [bacterium]|jgi:hypothetical protein|nr:hypothetical protein [bacterium]
MKGIVIAALLVAVTATATADDRDKARAAFRRGNQHYTLGEYKDALGEFKEAYRKFEDPSFLFNIGQCERQLDLRADAIRAYRMYLVNAPNATNREEVRQLIARLERELAEERATKAAPPPGVKPPHGEATATDGAVPATTPATSAATTAPAAAMTLTAAPPGRRETPTYKKWWVWTIVGVVVAGGAATGLALGLQPKSSTPTAMTSFGTASPF